MKGNLYCYRINLLKFRVYLLSQHNLSCSDSFTSQSHSTEGTNCVSSFFNQSIEYFPTIIHPVLLKEVPEVVLVTHLMSRKPCSFLNQVRESHSLCQLGICLEMDMWYDSGQRRIRGCLNTKFLRKTFPQVTKRWLLIFCSSWYKAWICGTVCW